MKKILFFMGLCLALNVDAKPNSENDSAIKKTIIAASIASYPGNCACPYNSASNGSRCGKRSAYNRAGGHAPLCYPQDVTAQMIKSYKASR
ncbi:hypothetical protein [Acinetobacter pullicarnis]|uniref:hypothetical protein n=1 Tax=Acinetobacter pullicarnis TaxID=2576829 RepID=UPI00111EAEC3|nr:hypothetical protein [Acinetobacter pullicarnis]